MSRKTRKLKAKLLAPFEWLGIGLGLAVLPWLSRRALFGVCDFLSAVLYRCDRRGRRFALETLRIVRGRERDTVRVLRFDVDRAAFDPTPAERTVLRRSYRNMVRTVGYAFWTFRRARARCAETGVMSEEGRRLLATYRPAVTVSGHIGCWEILSQLAFLEGHPMMSVAKDIGTAGMTRLLMRARRSIGQEIVSAEGAFRPLMAGIRAGKSLGLLVDQSVSPKKGGVWVRFLGHPICVSAAPAFFAAKAKAPVLVAWSRPLPDGPGPAYRCDVVDVIPPEAARDVWATTQRCARDLERIVRRHPSCWVMNYHFFNNWPRPEDLATLAEREAKAR